MDQNRPLNSPFKDLYKYQTEAIDLIFDNMKKNESDYNLLFQLPTGGGKTVIFSEIVKRYIRDTGKKALVLTHRIELCAQTSKMLNSFDVKNKIIDSNVKSLPDQDEYKCFVAMVETLNNRLQDQKLEVKDIGLVIIDEAHFNSFRKLFSYFDHSFILGVTATPLSSNIKLPMKDSYKELLVGNSIISLIADGFLARADIFNLDVGLTTLKVGANGDYTVKSSEDLYTQIHMQDKLVQAYEQKAKGKKTLIFNNGIFTSKYVYETFKAAGYDIKHLDNTNSKQERRDILYWFKTTPDAILTSVGILTTGFDEPTIEAIILNRATKSISLYYQMIGRGSRIIEDKKEFAVIDMGNNVARFGNWGENVDWQEIFRSPDFYLENIVSDADIEKNFVYTMGDEVIAMFAKSENIEFDVRKEYDKAISSGQRAKVVLEKSLEQHAQMCIENSEDAFDGRLLAQELDGAINDRVRRYSHCICKSTKNYISWLEDDYKRKLRLLIGQKFS